MCAWMPRHGAIWRSPQTLRGEPAPTLLSLLDTCATNMGSRLLHHWLHHPLRDRAVLNARLDAVGQTRASCQRARLHEQLKPCVDVERITARIALRSARPRDLSGLRDTLDDIAATACRCLPHADAPLIKQSGRSRCRPMRSSSRILRAHAAAPNLSSVLREGGVIADGFDAELDELRGIQTNCGDFLLALEARERARTGIANLKVEYNRVHGFYIEVTHAQSANVPDDYRRRQTLKNAERYITPELKTFEDKALSANERALAREKFLYEQLLDQLAPFIPQLQRIAAAIAELDVLATFAERAATLNLQRAAIHRRAADQHQHRAAIRWWKHKSSNFTPNDTTLNDARRMLLITGPNMGGKSTYMRQVALIALLAHVGSFVPAQAAALGEIDQIFTRIGASDDLASGRSTFMVEMTEAANILHVVSRFDHLVVRRAGWRNARLDICGLLSSQLGTRAPLAPRAQAVSAGHPGAGMQTAIAVTPRVVSISRGLRN